MLQTSPCGMATTGVCRDRETGNVFDPVEGPKIPTQHFRGSLASTEDASTFEGLPLNWSYYLLTKVNEIQG